MSERPKQVILAAYFPGVNNTTVWTDPALEEPDRVRLVRAPGPDGRAGQARLFFLAEGLRLREQRGLITTSTQSAAPTP